MVLLFGLGLGWLTLLGPLAHAQETPDPPPFLLPFADPPGPNTWFYQQHYGNTTAAYNFGNVWYEFGQGLHFGLDFKAACGTSVLAIADSVVAYVDADGFGAGPHNLVLDHPGTGYASFYGHLLRQPLLTRGQMVQRGQQIGLSGDPDGSCESRPHLHLEIRRSDYQSTVNPLPLFDVNWHMLASIGPFNHNFQQDLEAPYRWMTLESQPDVQFGGLIMNNYRRPWPLKLEVRAPLNTPIDRHLDPLPDKVQLSVTSVSTENWTIGAWWNPADLEAVYLIDAVPGQAAGVFRQSLDGSPRTYVSAAPPAQFSPDGSITVLPLGDGVMQIIRLSDGRSWEVDTGGNYPAVAPDNTRLLWEVVYGEIVPGTSTPGVQIVVSQLDGSQRRAIYTFSNGYSLWLDEHRLLIIKKIEYTAVTQLYIIDLDTIPTSTPAEPVLLGNYRYLHNLQIAPGGGRIAFFLAFQDDPAQSGVYVQRTQPGSAPRQLDFFGAYQWRDDRSLYTLSFDIAHDAHALGVVNVDDTHRWLTDPEDLPLRIANGEWHVAPDGQQIVFVDPADYGLYWLTMEKK